jgi:hypothetical protein
MSGMQPNGWRVLSQRPTERYMPSGDFEQVVEVKLAADDGTINTIVVPVGKYTRDYVIAQGNEWIERHNDIATIGNV